jgi:hypothetical protein
MKNFSKIFLLITFLFAVKYSQGQNKQIVDTLNYTVFSQKINFAMNDSIFPFTKYCTIDSIYFKPGFNLIDSNHRGVNIDMGKDRDIFLHYIYKFTNDSICNLHSLFPRISNTTDSPSNFEYTLIYSYVMNKLNESSLYNCSKCKTLRIYTPFENLLIRVDFLKRKVKIHFLKLDMNNEYEPMLIKNDSCDLASESITKIKSALHKIDFKNESIFNQGSGAELLIEYRDSENYWVFIRSVNDGDNIFWELYLLLEQLGCTK